ncbi:hexaprenyldihydroxybenzoate methyltransferase KNAG_0K00720 [Huiozyma naganishii CBS 8797]|uniref:Ubiquinone biosynthesis O-methyltransferase, mitochondrial n=1 Tax=Huiozyma naganishii (strain ATCC MYA-139 / BCRC 22969 / CBS 8797 / KCTC 17520 / NBRC 10181 / NCYC 3082 / Yp74L-3) TaxID=1071383 RepID=J7RC19_HUIN7|nr:hypothetical protein KNAG_0K00720 [Kazachstania naganishii CBS 8797]CCK72440.1 hypothetical protein KNAG_0K00720 [Kazachstania naganishii CBS 8797]
MWRSRVVSVSGALHRHLARNSVRFHSLKAASSLDGSAGTSSDELSHFKSLAPSWWDTEGSQRLLHQMNLMRMDFIQRNLRALETVEDADTFIPGYNYQEFLPKSVSKIVNQEWDQKVSDLLKKKQLSVLDVGCGGGILSESMARLPFVKHVRGIDLTEDCILIAQVHASSDPSLNGKLDYKVESLDKVHGKFDIVGCFEMLEHVSRPDIILEHCWNRLNQDGVLFLSTINRGFVSWFTTIFVAENVLGIVPRGTHQLKKFIKAQEVVEWFNKKHAKEFKILDLKGTMFVPMNGWVEHDCTSVGNYIMAIQKLH